MTERTILVVEDSEDFRFLAAAALCDSGCAVEFAENGREALAYLRSHELPAVIVLDLRMPELSGWELCAAMAADSALRRIPVIVYSAEPSIARIAQQLRAAGFVSKTDRPARLLEEVRRCWH